MSPDVENNGLSAEIQVCLFLFGVLCLFHAIIFFISHSYLLHVRRGGASYMQTDTHKQTQVPSSYIMFPLSKDLVNKSITQVTDLVSQPRLADVTQ